MVIQQSEELEKNGMVKALDFGIRGPGFRLQVCVVLVESHVLCELVSFVCLWGEWGGAVPTLVGRHDGRSEFCWECGQCGASWLLLGGEGSGDTLYFRDGFIGNSRWKLIYWVQ